MGHTRYTLAMLAAGVLAGGMLPSGGHAQTMPAEQAPAGLHVPRGPVVQEPWQRVDAAGCAWDIRTNGSIFQGSNNTYSGGMFCMINGAPVGFTAPPWANDAGDEIETGPAKAPGGIRICRRIKVYSDRGLARWLDIVKNASDKPAKVKFAHNTTLVTPVVTIDNPIADHSTRPDIAAFITQGDRQFGSLALLHVVGDEQAASPPDVKIENNRIQVEYELTLKPGQIAIVCAFESQGDVSGHRQTRQALPIAQLLEDLPIEVRRLIVNFRLDATICGRLTLHRYGASDTIVLKGDRTISGRIANTTFAIAAGPLGRLNLPASEVVGMSAESGQDSVFNVMLRDGQVMRGGVSPGTIDIDCDGLRQSIPLGDIDQWSYAVSADKPLVIPPALGVMLLRSGEILRFDSLDRRYRLSSLAGELDIAAEDIESIRLDGVPGGCHRVWLRNGSVLSGLVQPEQWPIRLDTVGAVTVPRDLIAEVRMARPAAPNPLSARMLLANGDVLRGDLARQTLRLATPFGPAEVAACDIRQLEFSPGPRRRAALRLWDSTVLRGTFSSPTIAFETSPGLTIHVPTGLCSRLDRLQPTSPAVTARNVGLLVARLGAELPEDRATAAKDLQQMGPVILPVLHDALATRDPQIRSSLQDVITQMENDSETTSPLEPLWPVAKSPDLAPQPIPRMIRQWIGGVD